MSLELALDTLRDRLAELGKSFAEVQRSVNFQPPYHKAQPVERLETLLIDMSSSLDEAAACVARARHASQPSGSLDAVRAGLEEAHRLVNTFAKAYVTELAKYGPLAQLFRMARERGQEWWDWAGTVYAAIKDCDAPLDGVMQSLVHGWAELADRLARSSVSVQATNIGQQVTVKDDQWDFAGKTT